MNRIMHFIFVAVFFIITSSIQGQENTEYSKTAVHVIDKLYDLVTFNPGQEVNWDQVRSLFITDAVIVLRTKRNETTIFDVDGFINDFIQFIDRVQAQKTGFTEKIIRKKSMIMGDMAHILVLYEAHIPGSKRPPQQGVDSFSLIYKENRWRIVAVTNEIPSLEVPIPAELQE